MIIIKVQYLSSNPIIKVTYDVTDITIGGGDVSPIYINLDYNASGAATNITSVGLSMPSGFTVSNSPLVISGTLGVQFDTGYSLPTDAEQATWDTAYNRSLTAANVSGTTTKTLTLTKQDGSTLQASWSDYDTAPVTSVFGRTGYVVATEGDYNLGQLGDVTITSPSTNQVLKYNGSAWVNGTDTDTGLTSVGISVPTGLQVSNSPLTSNGTIAISYGSGYSIPTDAKQTQWDSAYNDKINSAIVTGTSTKTLVLTQQDGGTIQASWSDIDTGLTSVGLTMPSAFTVSNSPLISNGTIGVTGAGTVSQYVRGDGSLAAFPTVPGGGGGGRIFYFNGNTSQGTIVGLPMYQLGVTASTGAAANFTASATGVLANFITDAGVPNLTQIPAGVWTVDAYLSETGGGSNHAELYAKLEVYNGSTVTLVGTSPLLQIVEGSFPTYYSFDISVPATAISATDRIVIQFYIQNTNGKSVTLYTEDGKIAEVHTTFTTGIGTLNGLTAATQYFAVGTSGTDFSISSVTDTHTFNLPTASASARGALSSSDWSVFNAKIGVNDTIDCGTW